MLYLLIHCIAMVPVNITEQSFTSECSVYIYKVIIIIIF